MGARRLGELFDRYGGRDRGGRLRRGHRPTTETYRREILAEDPVGTWVWEDYAEHDGVGEAARQRITLTRTPADDPEGERLVLDFGGTGPQARGPINHCGTTSTACSSRSGWRRSCATSPTPRADGRARRQRGRRAAHRHALPEPGTLLTPVTPAPTNARTFVIPRLLGVLAGVWPKAVEAGCPPTRRRSATPGVYGEDLDGRSYLMREVLGGARAGATTRTVGHHPRRPGLAEPADGVHRVALPVRGGVAVAGRDSGGAGQFVAGWATRSTSGCSRDAHFMSIADRSILACWGVQGRRARQAVRGRHRPRRSERARGRRPRRRRAGQRPGRPSDPDHRWRRLGQPARARPRPGRARRRRQKVRGGRARRLWRGAHRHRRRRHPRYDVEATNAERVSRPVPAATTPSSTAGLATARRRRSVRQRSTPSEDGRRGGRALLRHRQDRARPRAAVGPGGRGDTSARARGARRPAGGAGQRTRCTWSRRTCTRRAVVRPHGPVRRT